MDTPLIFVSAEHNDLDLDLSSVAVKPEVQRLQEIVRQIENLHEGVAYKAGEADDDVDTACAECQMPHPCATYKLINPPNYDEEAPF